MPLALEVLSSSAHPWSLLGPSHLFLCPELWFQLESFIHQLQTGPPSKLSAADPGPSEAADTLAPALYLCQCLLLSFLSPAPVLSQALWLFFITPTKLSIYLPGPGTGQLSPFIQSKCAILCRALARPPLSPTPLPSSCQPHFHPPVSCILYP